ncbi:MAG: VWA domain-containing protein [Deltaproteobacteria bacterium]|nr:VWA domain-containing protein [Deltaproteobacteria bacterium]
MKKLLCALSLIATTCLVSPLEAQQETTADTEATGGEIFFESMDVNVVNVEVYVTDSKGQSVPGLTAQDFELYEDGRQVEISNFYGYEGRPGRRDFAPPAPLEVSGTEGLPRSPLKTLEVPEDQRLYLILYFDNLHLRPFDRNRVAREVTRFLAREVGPEDRVMVVTYERTLHIRQPFTSDRRQVEKALLGMEKMTGFAVQKQAERVQVIRRVEKSESQLEAENFVDFFARSEFQDLQNSIEGLKEMVASLSGLPGRKALLHVTNGLPMKAAEDLYHFLDIKYGQSVSGRMQALRYSGRSQFRDLIAKANANRVTFYTLDATGLGSHGSVSAESQGRAEGGSLIDVDVARASNLQEPLQMMALDTGGISAFNTNNVAGALESMARDFNSYYSLGYAPAHSGDGRYYDLKVKVKKKGLKVRYRAGYRDKTPETRLAEGTLAVLLHGAGSNDLGLRMTFGSPTKRDDGFFLVPMEVQIPLAKVTLVPQEGDQHRGQLRVSSAVIDTKSGTSPPDLASLPLTIPSGDLAVARQKHYVYAIELLMRAGNQVVAVGLHDDLSGESSFLRQTVRVGSS